MDKKKLKIEELKKKQVFTVPEGYFDELPMRIQEKAVVSQRETSWNIVPVLKYALPVVLLAVVSVLWLQQSEVDTTQDAYAMLMEIPTDDIIDYIEDTDITFEEIMDEIKFDADVDQVQDQTEQIDSLSEEELELLLDEYELTGEYL